MRQSFPLMAAPENTLLRVISVKGSSAFAKRISEIGVNPGAEIRICQRNGAALVIGRGETRYAIGGGMANRIMVCEAS
ncbi:FeoA family protein [Stenoxybacter acetivorans]|uniref:FeoA family protein n=1 Tax=Stenoxybacter acetivorans TaxID=422441 RepID=UPI0005611C81|nr:FeoA family protein [Stenoxybacter acetivorans]